MIGNHFRSIAMEIFGNKLISFYMNFSFIARPNVGIEKCSVDLQLTGKSFELVEIFHAQ